VKAAHLFDLTDKAAVVTGAASGLGLAIAEALADNGARVGLLDRDAASLEAVTRQFEQAGREVLPLVIDVADTQGLDICFANAGMSAGPGYATEAGQMANVKIAEWQRVLDVNLTGIFATLQAASIPMKAQRSGRIVVTASVAGLKAEKPVGYAYAATKAAVINLVRQASRELAPHNVLVNAIAPGPFFTNIAGGRLHRDPEVVKMFADAVPLCRIAQPEEIQGLALLLASGASSFITGTVIPIDGGISAG
jgi:NAD(P)-dependent dehydrogenase (short-subunit alcohol dehydrogenase family)